MAVQQICQQRVVRQWAVSVLCITLKLDWNLSWMSASFKEKKTYLSRIKKLQFGDESKVFKSCWLQVKWSCFVPFMKVILLIQRAPERTDDLNNFMHLLMHCDTASLAWVWFISISLRDDVHARGHCVIYFLGLLSYSGREGLHVFIWTWSLRVKKNINFTYKIIYRLPKLIQEGHCVTSFQLDTSSKTRAIFLWMSM